MKEIKVCICDKNFKFKTEQDKQDFLEVVGIDEKPFLQRIGNREFFQHHLAWDMLRKAGWYHYGHDGEYLVWKKPETPVEELTLFIKGVDWYCEYSDDYGVVCAGQRKMKRLMELMLVVGEPTATEIYNQNCPEEMKK